MDNKIVNLFNKIEKFLKEVKIELQKVSWCSRAELKDSTVIVLISVFILAVIIGVFDAIMSKLINLVIR